MGEADHADGGGQKKKQPARGFCAVEAQGEPGEGECGEKSGDGARQARGGFADTEEFKAQGCAPIKEGRFLEPGLAVEARGDPVAGFGHVASDPGVARFVGADEADSAEVAEVADVQGGEDQDGPANAGD